MYVHCTHNFLTKQFLVKCNCTFIYTFAQGGRGYYTSPQSFIKCFLIRWLNNFEEFIEFYWFINLSVQTFQPLIVIYIMGNFMYHHWGSIYWPLSYPCKFLTFASFIQLVCVDVKIYFYPKIYNILVAAPLTSRGYVFLDWKNS